MSIPDEISVGWAEPAKPNMVYPAVVGLPAVSPTYTSQKNWSHSLLQNGRERTSFIGVIGFSAQLFSTEIYAYYTGRCYQQEGLP